LFLQIERDTGPRIIVATRAGLDQAAPKRGSLESAIVQLRRGATAKMEEFFERLAASGYERVSQVTTRGQFAVRGGIVDLYSWQAPLPFRLEFFGDQIESLREFDIDTQTSVRDLRSIDILLNQVAADQSGHVRDYVRERDLIIDVEPDGISNAHVQISEGWIETGPEDFSGVFQDCEIGEFGAGDLVLAEAKRAQFVDRLKEWRANNDRIIIYFQTEGEIERFREIMEGTVEGVDFVEGSLEGFCGCVVPNVTAPKSISANSLKTIWSSISSTASEDSSD
jgi:transcription-repair coupling factor (superfamily II helicase)